MAKLPNKWNDQDRKDFKNGVRLRAVTIQDKKKKWNKKACRIKIPLDHNFD